MPLQDYFIAEEELTVWRRNAGSQSFFLYVPIASILLRRDIHLDENLAPKVFSAALREWQRRLRTIELSDDEKEQCKDYLKGRIRSRRAGPNRIEAHSIAGYEVNWSWVEETGFTNAFSIGRNYGGSLYFNDSIHPRYVSKHAVKFSPEKMALYKIKGDEEHPQLFCYELHNVDSFISALLLLSWGRQYVNAALENLIKTSR